jgi:cytochrome c biogenesis protein CcmG/thiol:disulfide interchange protein DsbE
MKKPLIALLALFACLVGLGIGMLTAHAGRTAGKKNSSPANAAASSDKAMVIHFVKDPQPAPPFLLVDIDGRPVSTASWQGKVVIVNFWATWCPPCREEIPILIHLADKYKDDLVVVGISVDDGSPDEVREFAHQVGINYPIVMRSRELLLEYGGVPALPTSFVINKEGRVVQKHEGLFSLPLYETEVRALMGLPVDATITTFEDTGQIFLKNVERATELPGVDFSGLNAEQRKAALKRLNSQGCDCGCRFTLAQCRINDRGCPVSQGLAAKIVAEILASANNSKNSPAASQPATNQ